MEKNGRIIGTIFLPVLSWVSGAYLAKSFIGTAVFGIATMVVWILLLRSLAE